MAVNLSPSIRQRFFDSNGNPLSGGKLYCYQAGTSTPQDTYTDASGGTPNSNPVILDSSGYANVWLNVSSSYKFVLKDSLDNQQWSVDNVIGLTAANAVSTASIQDLAVTTGKIADGAITGSKLASDDTIDANRPVDTNNIRNRAITIAKLDQSTTTSSLDLKNLTLVASVSANALTVAVKTLAGTDATATDPCTASFRDPSSSAGKYILRTISSALSIVVPASTTIGTISGATEYIFVYLIDNAGSVELALSLNSLFDQSAVFSTTAIAGGASRSAMYSTTARSGVSFRLIGRIKLSEATAGTWSSAPTDFTIGPNIPTIPLVAKYFISANQAISNAFVNFDTKVKDTHGIVTTGSGWKATIPAGLEGDYKFDFMGMYATSSGSSGELCLYKNGVEVQVGIGSQPIVSYISGTITVCDLVAGDYIQINYDSSVTFAGNANGKYGHITITKVR